MDDALCRVIVACDSPGVRSSIGDLLHKAGLAPVVLDSSRDLLQIGALTQPAVLDTGEDISALCQVVYDIYDANPTQYTPPLVAVVNRDTLDRNPSLGRWMICGHAALAALVHDEREWERIPRLVRRLVAAEQE